MAPAAPAGGRGGAGRGWGAATGGAGLRPSLAVGRPPFWVSAAQREEGSLEREREGL